MNARIESNVETAALLPEGASVASNQATFSNIEQSRADYWKSLREFAASTHPGLFVGRSQAEAAEILQARFSPAEVRELEKRST